MEAKERMEHIVSILDSKKAEDIRAIRMERGMSQTDLAAAAGITIANLSRIEAGKFSVGLDILNKIAVALGVTLKLE